MRTAVLLLGITAALCGASRLGAEPPQYAVRYLGEGAKVEGINAHGVVTGWRLSPSPARSFVVGIDQPYLLLPLPDGYTTSLSWAINDAGVVVGEVSGIGDLKAAVWTPDGAGGYSVAMYGALPGQIPAHEYSTARGINNRGDIIGMSIVPGFSGGPTVWFNSPDGIIALGSGAPNNPTDVNDNGLVVGWSGGMFDLDTMTGMPLPPGNGGLIWAANNHGDICGFTPTSSETIAAVRWTETFGWQILGGSVNQSAPYAAYDINDSHVTVGKMVGGSIYFDDYGLLSLHDLLAPEFSNWILDPGYCAINNPGQIALFASNPNLGVGGIAVLTPLGEMIIPGDVNGDAFVDLADYCAWQASPIDLDGDGDADEADEQWLIDRLADLGFVVSDCNGNGIGDFCEIAAGTSLDCDGNGVPDECQDDCNGDGVPDACEPDCNDNGIADPCDIATGASQDCNGNGVPDECDGGSVVEAPNVFDPPLEMLEETTTVDDLLVVDVGVIEDVDFTLDIDYRVGNLTVLLSHGGATIRLIDLPGVPETSLGNGQLGYDIVLDDEGTGGPIEDEGNFGPPFEPITSPPSYTPNEALSAFDGMPSEGVWTVTVITNQVFSPIGTFNDWGLTITLAGVGVGKCDCAADLDGDGTIGAADLAMLLGLWGSEDTTGDLDGDGIVGSADLAVLLGGWGACP